MSNHLPALRLRHALQLVLAAAVPALLVLALPVRAVTQSTMVLTVELPDGPSAGARLFSEKGCARCHAIGGRGPRLGPDLGGTVLVGNVLELTGAFWNHAPVMGAKMKELGIRRPTVTTAEMADLVAFLTAFRYYDNRVRAPGNPVIGRQGRQIQGRRAECPARFAAGMIPTGR